MLILTVLQWTGTASKSINFILVWLQFNFYVFELNIVSNLSWKLGESVDSPWWMFIIKFLPLKFYFVVLKTAIILCRQTFRLQHTIT